MFGNRELYEISFKNVTIFYGGNGSGKSTLLNLIAQKLELNRIAPFNSSELFDEYVKIVSILSATMMRGSSTKYLTAVVL